MWVDFFLDKVKCGCVSNKTILNWSIIKERCGLCIDALEQMVDEFVKQEDIAEVIIRNVGIVLMLCKCVLFLANTSELVQKNMSVLK